MDNSFRKNEWISMEKCRIFYCRKVLRRTKKLSTIWCHNRWIRDALVVFSFRRIPYFGRYYSCFTNYIQLILVEQENNTYVSNGTLDDPLNASYTHFSMLWIIQRVHSRCTTDHESRDKNCQQRNPEVGDFYFGFFPPWTNAVCRSMCSVRFHLNNFEIIMMHPAIPEVVV